MNVKIVLFPEGEDPDSFARNHRTSEIEGFITTQAKDFIGFKTSLLLEETKGDPNAKTQLIKEIIQTISHIPDGIGRTVYIQECSNIMDVPEQTLMNELNKILRNRYRKTNQSFDAPEPEFVEKKPVAIGQFRFDPLEIKPLEDELMRLLLHHSNDSFVLDTHEEEETEEYNVLEFVVDELDNDEMTFSNDIYNLMLIEMKQEVEKNGSVSSTFFIHHENPDISSTAINLITERYELSENWEKNKIFVKRAHDLLSQFVMTTVMALKSKHVARKLRKITEDIKVATEDAEMTLLQMEFFELKKISALIDKELERPFNH